MFVCVQDDCFSQKGNHFGKLLCYRSDRKGSDQTDCLTKKKNTNSLHAWKI
jgi:hypothetical protein